MLNKNIHAARFSFPPLSIDPSGTVLVFDKPYQCTSFDLVNKLKQTIRREMNLKIKVGHAGTLDPLATGVLIVCVGTFTKKIEQFQSAEKEYTGTIKLGATTPSFDLEKPVDHEYPICHITREKVDEAAKAFIGQIKQIPPHYSAVWIDGKRAFEYARQGEEVIIRPKEIVIREFEITRCEIPEIDFRIVCSKGTYIRAIARDLGYLLNSGAHLLNLRRTRIGNFTIADAIQCIIE